MRIISLSEPGNFAFWCPGCLEYHRFDNTHAFNGNTDRPTIHTSIEARCTPKPSLGLHTLADRETKGTCHSFVKDGMIQFLDNCTHKLVGQTVEIPRIE